MYKPDNSLDLITLLSCLVKRSIMLIVCVYSGTAFIFRINIYTSVGVMEKLSANAKHFCLYYNIVNCSIVEFLPIFQYHKN
jgi:hypothetical protein